MTWIEGVAAIFGLLCVWLTVRQNIWCWPVGLVQVVLFIGVFYQARLYSDVVLHVIYVFLQLYGWHYWLHGGRDRTELQVSLLAWPMLFAWIVVGIVGTALWGFGMATFTDAATPYPDAFIAVMSLVAQWLMARKKLEAWLFWIVVDVVAVILFFERALFITSALYGVFLVLAVLGYFQWRRTLPASDLPLAAELGA